MERVAIPLHPPVCPETERVLSQPGRERLPVALRNRAVEVVRENSGSLGGDAAAYLGAPLLPIAVSLAQMIHDRIGRGIARQESVNRLREKSVEGERGGFTDL